MKEEKLQSLDDVGFPLLWNRHTLAANAKVIVIRSRTFTFVLKTKEEKKCEKHRAPDGGCDGKNKCGGFNFCDFVRAAGRAYRLQFSIVCD